MVDVLDFLNMYQDQDCTHTFYHFALLFLWINVWLIKVCSLRSLGT
jgi:hypothetical protein